MSIKRKLEYPPPKFNNHWVGVFAFIDYEGNKSTMMGKLIAPAGVKVRYEGFIDGVRPVFIGQAIEPEYFWLLCKDAYGRRVRRWEITWWQMSGFEIATIVDISVIHEKRKEKIEKYLKRGGVDYEAIVRIWDKFVLTVMDKPLRIINDDFKSHEVLINDGGEYVFVGRSSIKKSIYR